MKKSEKGKQRTIMFTVLVHVIPAAALLLILIWLGTRFLALQALEKEIANNLDARTFMTAKSVGERLDSLKSYAEVLSSNDLIINSLIDYTARENYLPTFFTSLQVPGVKNALIVLLDYKGRVIVSNHLIPPELMAELMAEFASTGMQEAVMEKGSLRFNVTDHCLAILSPVFYNGLTEGMVFIHHDIKDLAPVFNPNSQIMDVAVLLKPDKLIFSTSADFSREIISINTLSENGKNHYDINFQWLMKSAAIPGYGSLEVICGIKQQAAFNQHAKMETFLIAAMILDLAALVSGIFFSARLTANPLKNFVERIDKARASGTFNADLPETGTAEIVSLASAFNALVKESEQAKAQLLNKAMEAGRAQLSAMVLHNIGNAVTPLGIQIKQMEPKEASQLQSLLDKCYQDLKNNRKNLADYVGNDKRGRQVFEYMESLIEALKKSCESQEKRVEKAGTDVSYIAEILSLQQNFAPSLRENKETINLNKIMETSIHINQSALKKRHIVLNTDFAAQMKPLIIDKSRLLQVVVNLIKNSYEAIDQLTENVIDKSGNGDRDKIEKEKNAVKMITITTFSADSQTGFEIRDRGIGIEPAKTASLFEFGKSEKGSSGMGLYYCKMFIEANHGTITMTSEGAGKGAVVRVVFN
ncbi:MAG: HAMP domain-containing sensor histidine kinase [Thermodesulfobacteriota bacterium]|nr:HAMP domain-containing sensor histidine kinase [Thermodesulfobacteriota bacterium]